MDYFKESEQLHNELEGILKDNGIEAYGIF